VSNGLPVETLIDPNEILVALKVQLISCDRPGETAKMSKAAAVI
jgi:hypothetical protein